MIARNDDLATRVQEHLNRLSLRNHLTVFTNDFVLGAFAGGDALVGQLIQLLHLGPAPTAAASSPAALFLSAAPAPTLSELAILLLHSYGVCSVFGIASRRCLQVAPLPPASQESCLFVSGHCGLTSI